MIHIENSLCKIFIAFWILAALFLGGCKKVGTPEVITPEAEPTVAHRRDNAIYYWKTTFRFTESDSLFLANHQVNRLYLRYFDVVVKKWEGIPDATIRFLDPIPEGLNIIPTVFIDQKVFSNGSAAHTLAEKIAKRILIMSETNDIRNIREIQIDCDWTKTTEKVYFLFLKQLRKLLKENGISLSTTIRLHQLNMPVPPVDRGVLMCYNTGALRNYTLTNSILSVNDVKPYAHRLKEYTLPLDIAYPSFSWAVCFKDKQFQFLLRGLSPDHTNLRHLKAGLYKVTEAFEQEGQQLEKGMELRFETSDYDEIIASKKLLEPQLNDYSVILYHMDSTNLSKYPFYEIKSIYNSLPSITL